MPDAEGFPDQSALEMFSSSIVPLTISAITAGIFSGWKVAVC